MSFTLTSAHEKTSTIYLTPSKRPRRHDMQNYSVKELHSWTFSAEAVASCTVHDVLNMKKNLLDDYEFYWLGRVPCRTVKVVGILVGVQVYERKIVYSIDDGTGVIDCNHSHRSLRSPAKHNVKDTKYQRPETDVILASPRPIAEIGQTIELIGSVRALWDSRVITVTRIDLCPSPNVELMHAKLVLQLHRTHYFCEEPFEIPPQSTKNIFYYDTPVRNNAPSTPSTRTTCVPSSVSSSPVKSSPIKDDVIVVPISPAKLRHPSRLHTHDLTENTFRIYAKHYMDHAPLSHLNVSGYDSETAIEKSLEQMPSTPTKRPRSNPLADTPRPHFRYSVDSTPKPSSTTNPRYRSVRVRDEKPKLEGFTLSYLRRVPELSLLASRVVQAVANRSQREERKRLREAGVISSSKKSSSSSASMAVVPPDQFARKKKRLFQWAIIQLLKEGGIVLWDGPVRRCSELGFIVSDASRLWKTGSTSTRTDADSTLFGNESASLSTPFMNGGGSLSGYLSDPQSNEESYISLTPSYLAPHIEDAVKVLVEYYSQKGKPYAGATKEGILSVLRKDDRWKYVGAWTVQDALEVLKLEDKVWDMGKGRWDLTA